MRMSIAREHLASDSLIERVPSGVPFLLGQIQQQNMVGVVQLAEHWIVVPGVVGSSPITHPMKNSDAKASEFFQLNFPAGATCIFFLLRI